MIVTCPACQTRYFVDDAAFGGATERRARCASCGYDWHHSPNAAAIQAGMAEARAAIAAAAAAPTAAVPAPVAPALRPEPEPDTEPPPRPAGPAALVLRPSVDAELPEAIRRRRATVRAIGLIALVAALVLVAVRGRERIMAMWPSVTPVYALLDLTEPPGMGLEVTMAQTRTPDSFVVSGDIVNGGATPQQVPRLRITLRDGTDSSLVSKVIDPPVKQLRPGATAHFTTTFEHPSVTAVSADVIFVPD